jgi:hypothetical protein
MNSMTHFINCGSLTIFSCLPEPGMLMSQLIQSWEKSYPWQHLTYKAWGYAKLKDFLAEMGHIVALKPASTLNDFRLSAHAAPARTYSDSDLQAAPEPPAHAYSDAEASEETKGPMDASPNKHVATSQTKLQTGAELGLQQNHRAQVASKEAQQTHSPAYPPGKQFGIHEILSQVEAGDQDTRGAGHKVRDDGRKRPANVPAVCEGAVKAEQQVDSAHVHGVGVEILAGESNHGDCIDVYPGEAATYPDCEQVRIEKGSWIRLPPGLRASGDAEASDEAVQAQERLRDAHNGVSSDENVHQGETTDGHELRHSSGHDPWQHLEDMEEGVAKDLWTDILEMRQERGLLPPRKHTHPTQESASEADDDREGGWGRPEYEVLAPGMQARVRHQGEADGAVHFDKEEDAGQAWEHSQAVYKGRGTCGAGKGGAWYQEEVAQQEFDQGTPVRAPKEGQKAATEHVETSFNQYMSQVHETVVQSAGTRCERTGAAQKAYLMQMREARDQWAAMYMRKHAGDKGLQNWQANAAKGSSAGIPAGRKADKPTDGLLERTAANTPKVAHVPALEHLQNAGGAAVLDQVQAKTLNDKTEFHKKFRVDADEKRAKGLAQAKSGYLLRGQAEQMLMACNQQVQVLCMRECIWFVVDCKFHEFPYTLIFVHTKMICIIYVCVSLSVVCIYVSMSMHICMKV